MDFLRAAILGIVQGLAEFLPISSSGHLILVPALFGWEDQGLAFDVGLHVGTLVVLLVYFWRDWARMFGKGLRDFARHRFAFREHAQESRLLWLMRSVRSRRVWWAFSSMTGSRRTSGSRGWWRSCSRCSAW